MMDMSVTAEARGAFVEFCDLSSYITPYTRTSTGEVEKRTDQTILLMKRILEMLYAVGLADRRLMALAGLWENWRSPAGDWVRSFAIITTTPNALCAQLHNRMPVVLKPESWPAWLGEEAANARHLKALLAPYQRRDGLLAGESAGRQCQKQ